jgi:hypothetical protein
MNQEDSAVRWRSVGSVEQCALEVDNNVAYPWTMNIGISSVVLTLFGGTWLAQSSGPAEPTSVAVGDSTTSEDVEAAVPMTGVTPSDEIASKIPPTVRGVEGDGLLVCMETGKVFEDLQECPLRILEVGMAPIADGPMVIPQWVSTVSPAVGEEDLGEPCGDMRLVNAQVSMPGQEIGRSMTTMSLDSRSYGKRIKAATGAAEVKLRELVRVDLDGNGTEEVLFEVNSHDGFMLEGPTEIVSIVGMRAIVEGEVKTFLLHDTQQSLGRGDQIHYWQRGSLNGVTDVEGDGRLEIVVGDTYYEGGYTGVFTFDGAQPKLLGGYGCGA